MKLLVGLTILACYGTYANRPDSTVGKVAGVTGALVAVVAGIAWNAMGGLS